MDAQPHGELLHLQALTLLRTRILQIIVLLDRLLQVSEDVARLAIIEGRSEVRNQTPIRAALGHHTLPDITYRIIIEVGIRCDKCFPPITCAEGYLLTWRELQAPVCTEVHQGISPKDVARPQVRIDIRIGRRRGYTVDDLEVIIPNSSYGLRK